MTWNYRIVKYRDHDAYGLHEVYYDDQGKPTSMTERPCSFSCDAEDGPESISDMLSRALNDAKSRPVLMEPDWGNQSK